jgi:hypothetical protein
MRVLFRLRPADLQILQRPVADLGDGVFQLPGHFPRSSDYALRCDFAGGPRGFASIPSSISLLPLPVHQQKAFQLTSGLQSVIR